MTKEVSIKPKSSVMYIQIHVDNTTPDIKDIKIDVTNATPNVNICRTLH